MALELSTRSDGQTTRDERRSEDRDRAQRDRGETTIGDIARRNAMSEQTISTWRDQFLAGGRTALQTASARRMSSCVGMTTPFGPTVIRTGPTHRPIG